MSVSAHVRQPGGLDVLGEPAGLHLHTGPVVMFSTSRLTWARQCWQSVQTQCWSSLLARRRLQRRPSWGAGRAGRLAGSPVSPPHSARLEESPVWVEAVTLLAQLLHTVWQHSQHFTPPCTVQYSGALCCREHYLEQPEPGLETESADATLFRRLPHPVRDRQALGKQLS